MAAIRTDAEIYEQIDKATEHINDGTGNTFNSYEEGVKDALNWVLGQDNNPPIED